MLRLALRAGNLGGVFGVRVSGTNLELTFTAVPEPGIWMMAGILCLIALGIRAQRRWARRSSGSGV